MDITLQAMDLDMRIRFHGAMMNMALDSCRKLLDNNRRSMVDVSTAVNCMSQLVEKDHQSGEITAVSENHYLIDIKASQLRTAWNQVLDRQPKFPGSGAINTRINEALQEAGRLSAAVKDLQQETCGSK